MARAGSFAVVLKARLLPPEPDRATVFMTKLMLSKKAKSQKAGLATPNNVDMRVLIYHTGDETQPRVVQVIFCANMVPSCFANRRPVGTSPRRVQPYCLSATVNQRRT